MKSVSTDIICPECGQPLVVRWGKNGEFLGCNAYPQCKYTGNFTRDQNGKLVLVAKAPETDDYPCPQESCSGTLVRRRSRRGFFYGCSRYPDCSFASWDRPVARPCPACGAKFLVERTTKKQGNLHMCLNPDCGFKEHVAE